MISASHEEENALLATYAGTTLAGIDEVGRGAIAGPLVSVCVVRKKDTVFSGVRDSKLLRHEQRTRLIPPLFEQSITWGAGVIESTDITVKGMSWAIRESFSRALKACSVRPDVVVYDGIQLPLPHDNAIHVINGDATHATISAASIIAKVLRDMIMISYAEDYPQYGFDKHKGYGTEFHRKQIQRYGLIDDLHRASFYHG